MSFRPAPNDHSHTLRSAPGNQGHVGNPPSADDVADERARQHDARRAHRAAARAAHRAVEAERAGDRAAADHADAVSPAAAFRRQPPGA